MIKQLTKLANDLDLKGLRREADYLDSIIIKLCDDIDTAPGDAAVDPEPQIEEVSDAQLRQEEAKIVGWNEEWLKTLEPGTYRGNKLAKALKLENLQGNRESRYKFWWRTTLKPILTLKLPGADQYGRLQFVWNPELGMPTEEKAHGAYGRATVWSKDKARIQLDVPYWFDEERTEPERKWLLFHELEHVLDFIATNTGTSISSSKGQKKLYTRVFNEEYLPPIFKKLERDTNKLYTRWFKEYRDKNPDVEISKVFNMMNEDDEFISAYTKSIKAAGIPLSFSWGAGRSDQRSEMQTLLASNGGVMDMPRMNKLCKLKSKLEDYDWGGNTWEDKTDFITSIYKESLIRVEVLVMLNCEDKEKVVSSINEMANSGKPMSEKFDRGSEPTNDGGSFLA
jgi:hypothetical protein